MSRPPAKRAPRKHCSPPYCFVICVFSGRLADFLFRAACRVKPGDTDVGVSGAGSPLNIVPASTSRAAVAPAPIHVRVTPTSAATGGRPAAAESTWFKDLSPVTVYSYSAMHATADPNAADYFNPLKAGSVTLAAQQLANDAGEDADGVATVTL